MAQTRTCRVCNEASAAIEAQSSTEKSDAEGAQQSRVAAWGGGASQFVPFVNTKLAL